MIRKLKWEPILVICVAALYLGVTVYHLQDLPAEWYGDISIEHRAVAAILSGHWPWQFSLSAGPAYHYIVAAFAFFLGASYETYKLASVITGLVSILLIYLLGKEFGGVRLGLLSAFAGAISFWMVLFARLGSSPQILSPVLSAGAVYFLLRFKRARHWYDAAVSMVFAGFGLFTYPSTFVIPFLILGLILWQLIFTRPRGPWWRALAIAIVVMLPFVIWFFFTIKANSSFTQAGYVGSKVTQQREPLTAVALTFGNNMLKALGMFQFRGDHAFRTNIPGKPVLDPLSGVMMDLGLIWLFLNPRLRGQWIFALAPILFLVMPSAAPGILPIEIPSASRSLGAAPFVFLLVGIGVEAVWVAVQSLFASRGRLRAGISKTFSYAAAPDADISYSKWQIPLTGAVPTDRLNSRGRWISGIAIGITLLAIGYFNIHEYFNIYAWQLPGHNQPWNELIVQYIQTLPPKTNVKMTACCWEDAEQPSLEVVNFLLADAQNQPNLYTKAYIKSCQDIKPGANYVIIFPPKADSPLARRFRGCFPSSTGLMHFDHLGQAAFYSLAVDLRH